MSLEKDNVDFNILKTLLENGNNAEFINAFNTLDNETKTKYLSLQDDKSNSLFHYAAVQGNTEVANALLQYTNIEHIMKNNDMERNFIHIACKNGNFDFLSVFKKWISFAANQPDVYGRFPLHYAAAVQGNKELPFLYKLYGSKEHGPNLYEYKDKDGEDPLAIAKNNGNSFIQKDIETKKKSEKLERIMSIAYMALTIVGIVFIPLLIHLRSKDEKLINIAYQNSIDKFNNYQANKKATSPSVDADKNTPLESKNKNKFFINQFKPEVPQIRPTGNLKEKEEEKGSPHAPGKE